MKKISGIFSVLTALCLVFLLGNGSCKNPKAHENTQATAAVQVPQPVQPKPIKIAPDPENAVRFELVYSSNLNAEYEPCG